MGRKMNAYCLLRDREYSVKYNYRTNHLALRNLVCQKDAKFVKVWEKHLNFPVAYDSGKLYCDNYRTCFHVHGHNGKPQKLYKLPPCPTSQKIEDCLIAQCSLSELPQEYHGNKSSFYGLTAHNWLHRYDLDTGQMLQTVYLSTRVKFRHLSFESDLQRIVIKSTHQRVTQLAREAGVVHNLLMVLAVFNIFPLQFVGMVEVTKNIFGRDISDAMISQGTLIVMHQGGYIKIYSLEHILQQGMLFEAELYTKCPENDNSVVGEFPSGVPLNIKLNVCPPVLFSVRCAEHNLNLGGFPWHYIITPYGSQGHFHVYSLDNSQLARGGSLDMGTYSVEPDKCIFHHDESGRIVHIGANEVKILGIKPSSHGNQGPKAPSPQNAFQPQFEVVEEFSLVSSKNKAVTEKPFDGVTYTSSGRMVKRKQSYEDEGMLDTCYEAIQYVDYENELDLLLVTAAQPEGDTFQGMLHIHNNDTGEHLKTVTLDEPWIECASHTVSLDLDTLVHIVKAPMRRFSCYVYRLDRSLDEDQILLQRRSRKGSYHTKLNNTDADLQSHRLTRVRQAGTKHSSTVSNTRGSHSPQSDTTSSNTTSRDTTPSSGHSNTTATQSSSQVLQDSEPVDLIVGSAYLDSPISSNSERVTPVFHDSSTTDSEEQTDNTREERVCPDSIHSHSLPHRPSRSQSSRTRQSRPQSSRTGQSRPQSSSTSQSSPQSNRTSSLRLREGDHDYSKYFIEDTDSE